MKITILHLSDIHFKPQNNPISNKAPSIIRAIQEDLKSSSGVIIAITGDIAFSGKKEEYDKAKEFLAQLTTIIKETSNTTAIEIAMAPGNHDCDFSKEDQVRKILLETIASPTDSSASVAPEVVKQITGIQDDFFKFLSEITSTEPQEGIKRISHSRCIQLGSKKIITNTYNSAWLSRLKERQALLRIPANALLPYESCDLALTILHHPYNWHGADSGRAFQKHAESNSDFILTGHEHDSAIYEKSSITGENPRYLEGAVLQDSTIPPSGFNVLLVDLDKGLERRAQYNWVKEESLYRPQSKSEWIRLRRAKEERARSFDNTKDFLATLTDVGVAFTHPSARNLTPRDIFIYPDIDDRPYQKPQKSATSAPVTGERLTTHVIENPHTLFVGSERSGKTALAKILYQDFQQHGLAPILLSGDSIRSAQQDDFIEQADRAVSRQYGSDALEKFRQLATESKAIIIDDFHRSKLNSKGKSQILQLAKLHFKYVIAFVDDIYVLEEAAHRESHESLTSFRHCAIREFGHRLRGKLIEKWCGLGNEFTGDISETEHKISQLENAVDTLLGKNLLPSYPLFVLTLLQLREAQKNLSTASGAYGYIYEVLITGALSDDNQDITLDTKYTYISMLAYRLFDSDKRILSEDDIYEVTDNHFRHYRVRINKDEMIRSLQASLALEQAEGGYRFKYKYLYYYFVARFIQDNLANPALRDSLRATVSNMTGKLYNEDFANILIFFLYLTKDSDTITQMLSHARQLYSEYEPANLDKGVFALSASGESPHFHLVEKDQKIAREEYRQQLDINDERGDYLSEKGTDLPDEAVKLNVAFKTLQIMGQILRNFPGSLSGDLKLNIARESYLLGLRTLQAAFSIIEGCKDELRIFFKDFLKEDKKMPEGDALEKKTEQILFLFQVFLAHGLVKRVSLAVGSKHLRETFKEVLAGIDTVSVRLIDIAIKLDHVRPIPDEEIVETYDNIKSSFFSSSILRRLIVEHLYLYKTNYRTRQKLCERLGISSSDTKMLQTHNKK